MKYNEECEYGLWERIKEETALGFIPESSGLSSMGLHLLVDLTTESSIVSDTYWPHVVGFQYIFND